MIGCVLWFIVSCFVWDVFDEEVVVFDVLIKLIWVYVVMVDLVVIVLEFG